MNGNHPGRGGVHRFDREKDPNLDTGPDDANHAQDGLWIAAGPGVDARGRVDAHLLDIAPTVLELLEVEQPDGMRGTSLASTLARA